MACVGAATVISAGHGCCDEATLSAPVVPCCFVSAPTTAVAGTATIDAPGGMTINGDVTVNGTVTATTDVIGGGKSLKGHKHSGVQAGGAQTGAPV